MEVTPAAVIVVLCCILSNLQAWPEHSSNVMSTALFANTSQGCRSRLMRTLHQIRDVQPWLVLADKAHPCLPTSHPALAT